MKALVTNRKIWWLVISLAVGFSAFALWKGGLAADKSDELLRAEEALRTVVQSDPTNAELWTHLALVQHKLGNLEEAEKSFLKVVELRPGESGAHYMLALIYEKKGMKRKAIEAWEACLEHSKDPNMAMIAKKHLKHLRK